jgi:hypothetical protein
MTETSYKRTYKLAIDELTKLMEQYEDLEGQMETLRRRINTVRRGVYGVAALCGVNPEKEYPDLFPRTLSSDTGFTDAIRQVLKSKGKFAYFTPVGVRDELKTMGFDLSKYKNPLASIHTTLKRLETRGQVAGETSDSGGVLYSWKDWPEETDDDIPF